MNIQQTTNFKKASKKLHVDEKKALDIAVRTLIQDPLLGEQKKGDLSYLRVYKYKMGLKQFLLGYEYNKETQTIFLTALGPHENFYRDLK